MVEKNYTALLSQGIVEPNADWGNWHCGYWLECVLLLPAEINDLFDSGDGNQHACRLACLMYYICKHRTGSGSLCSYNNQLQFWLENCTLYCTNHSCTWLSLMFNLIQFIESSHFLINLNFQAWLILSVRNNLSIFCLCNLKDIFQPVLL